MGKVQVLEGGLQKTKIYRGIASKGGDWTVCGFMGGGGLRKQEGVVFSREGVIL